MRENMRVGLLLGSVHPFEDKTSCPDDERIDVNDTSQGLYLAYGGFAAGRYRNSFANCTGIEYSNLIAYEWQLGRWKSIYFSTSIGVADGYPEIDDVGEYRGMLSINVRVSIAKLFYGYTASAIGLEFDL